MAFLIVHSEWGICLGHCMGLFFWSKMDPVGQTDAVAFASEAEAKEMITKMAFPDGNDHAVLLKLVPVEADHGDWASMAACIRAGQDPWFDESWAVANELPC